MITYFKIQTDRQYTETYQTIYCKSVYAYKCSITGFAVYTVFFYDKCRTIVGSVEITDYDDRQEFIDSILYMYDIGEYIELSYSNADIVSIQSFFNTTVG